MTDGHSRRNFLKGLLRDTARGVQEVSAAMPNVGSLTGELIGATSAPAEDRPRLRARCAVGITADERDLASLIAEHGLQGHAEELAALARRTVRLTATAPRFADGRLGGRVTLPDGVPGPTHDGRPLRLLASVDLVGSRLAGLDLPTGSALLLYYDLQERPDGRRERQRGSARALLVPPPAEVSGGLPVAASVELTLPRLWSDAVQSLDLAPDEQDAYDAMRCALAMRQGVEEEHAAFDEADNRLFGLPADTTGLQPAICEAIARHLDADGVFDDDFVREAAAGWRMLAQITVDTELRVFFWVRAEDLARGDVSRVWALTG